MTKGCTSYLPKKRERKWFRISSVGNCLNHFSQVFGLLSHMKSLHRMSKKNIKELMLLSRATPCPVLKAAAKCKKVKRLKCNQYTVLVIRNTRSLLALPRELLTRTATRTTVATLNQPPPRYTRWEPAVLLYGFVCAELE